MNARMKTYFRARHGAPGFSIVELMIAITIGLIILAGVVTIFMAQRAVVSSSSAQAFMQDDENAFSSIVMSNLRNAGFVGCNSMAYNNNNVQSNTAATPSTFSRGDFSAPVFGFDYNGTHNGGSYTFASLNQSAPASASSWTPSLPDSLSTLPEAGSDVLVVNSIAPGTHTLAVSSVMQQDDPNQFRVYNSASKSPSGSPLAWSTLNGTPLQVQVSALAISDCAKSTTFVPVMAVDANGFATIQNPVIVAGTGSPGAGNVLTSIEPVYQSGVQMLPVQQVAYYVGRGTDGQSGLFRAVMINGKWLSGEIIPGVDAMQVLYGVGVNGQNQGYLSADAVQALSANPPAGITVLPYNPWLSVQSVRIALLLQGPMGSAPVGSNLTSWAMLGTQITVPEDTRLRYVATFTAQLRNSAYAQQ